MGKPEFVISEETGKKLLEWTNSGSKPVLMSETQNKRLHALISETNSDREALKDYFGLESMKDMTEEQYLKAEKMLLAKRQEH